MQDSGHPPRNSIAAAAAAAALAALLLSACGGGGSASSSAPSPAAPASTVVSGVVATGSPVAGAGVKVRDRGGVEVCATVAADDGRYSCTLSADVRGPLAVVATRDDMVLVSTAASAVTGTVNVTPLTTLIAARLAPDGDPGHLGDAIKADPAVASAANVQAKVEEVKRLLAPLLAAAGDELDPISGNFAADGTGHDQVLDTLQVSIRPEANSSNIEITVKLKPDSDGSAPVSLSFRSSDTAPAPLAVTIRSADLPESGLLGLMNGFVGRMTACYAEPLTQRIAGVAAGATEATGAAADVQAQACRSLFLDSDPGTYRHDGLLVGSAGAFPGLFSDTSTGAKFDRVNLDHQLANGDYRVSFRSVTAAGIGSDVALTLRKQDGLLRAVGNQYAYNASLKPVAVDREFPLQPKFSWFGSGYGATIRNDVDPVTRLPLFKEAYVTAPDGRRTVYRPLAGNFAMGILHSSGRQTSNSNQQYAAVFQDPTTPGHPADKDGNGGATFVDPQIGDEALRALPDQGVWTIEWVHADTSRANVTQTYRTTSRAPTMGEVRQMKFAQLSEAFRAELVARSDVSTRNAMIFGDPSAANANVFALATAAGGDGWVVPDGAHAPRTLSINGAAASGAFFSNTTNVLPTDRSGRVRCVTQSAGDLHCDASTGVLQFAAGARVTFFALSITAPRNLAVSKHIGLYRLAE